MKKKKTAAKSNNKHLKKKVYTTAVTLGLTAGAVVGVAAYQSSQEFTPSGENRDLNANQVLFPYDEGDNGLDSSTKDERDSALLDKSKTEDQLHMADDASFLFDNSQYTPDNPTNQTAMTDDSTPQGETAAIADQTTDPGQVTPTPGGTTDNATAPDTIYDVVDDKDKADTIINNPTTDPTPGNTDVDTGNGDTGNGDTGNGSGDGNGNGQNGNGNGNSNGNGQDSSDNGKNDSNSGDKKTSNDNNSTPSKPSRPSDTAKDPGSSLEDKKQPVSSSGEDKIKYEQITDSTENTLGKNNESDYRK